MDTPQPAVELSLFQFEGFNDALMAVATDRMEGDRQTRRALRKLQSNRHRSRVATHEAYRKYMAEGGSEDGSVTGFLEWLIANWESIFKIIMQIVGLFGAAATPIDGAQPEAAQAFPFPQVDIDLIAESAKSLEEMRKALENAWAIFQKLKASIPGLG